VHVKDVMSPGVATVDPATSLTLAARQMRDRAIGCLPVVEGDQLVGMITDRDVVIRSLADGLDAHRTPVRAAMSAVALSCFADQTVEDAQQIMTDNRIKHLPVLNRRNRLVGILSHADIVGRGPKCKPRQVRFYKNVSTNSGQVRHVSMATIYLSPAVKKEDVAAAAIRKFEGDQRIEPWSQLADGYEIVGRE
jgi:CBS domain-containing protein